MDKEMEVEVFRAGDYGERGVFDENALDAIARDYDPKKHESPVTVDHHQDGPALGWVRGLRRSGRVLLARLGGLEEGFMEKLKNGAFKKRSVELYRAFEQTGRPYLRAVTFLGAAAPVVKGLEDPVFSEDLTEGEPIPFEKKVQTPAATEPPQPTEEALAFCEALREAGRVLPAWEKKGMPLFLSRLDDEAPLPFQEGEEKTMRTWFQEFLDALPPAVPLGEQTPATDAPRFAEPPRPEHWKRADIDEASLQLDRQVQAFRRSHPDCAYSEALRLVSRQPAL